MTAVTDAGYRQERTERKQYNIIKDKRTRHGKSLEPARAEPIQKRPLRQLQSLKREKKEKTLPAGAIKSWTSLGIVRLVSRCHCDMNFRILFRTVLTVALFVALSSLRGVERPTASAKCFRSSILRRSELGYFVSYLRRVSACYSRLDFMISKHAFQTSIIAAYLGLLLRASSLWSGLLSIPDLPSESPSLRAASICSSGFSPLQHPFARSVLMVCRVLHARMQISGVGTRKKGLAREMGEGSER